MNLGDILVAKGLVSEEDIKRALENQRQNGGRLGESIVALGMLTTEQINKVIEDAPQAPLTAAGTGIDPALLLELAMKGMYTENLETASQIAEALRLSSTIVNQLLNEAKERKFLETLAVASGVGSMAELRLSLTRAGREFAADAMKRGQYFGPAPVSLKDYQDRILSQRVTNELVTRKRLEEGFAGLVMTERFLSRLGPAVNSGNAILIYGPAGNGKTTVAEIVGKIFENVIYIPYCVDLDGEIMKVYDPAYHRKVADVGEQQQGVANVRRSRVDMRWVACHRPMVITGGELTIEMLDLKYNAIAKLYEAPLHVKALNGTFLIDDFGRQRAKPEDILNRWIVPLNSRVDYLTLHTGKSVTIPFDEIVIFSTNMHPDDLMDPAFQRRIGYKLETVAPPEDLFRKVFRGMATKFSLDLSDDVYKQVVDRINECEAPLAYFQPKFIIEQVLASCKFEGTKPQFTPENVEDALSNLFIKKPDGKMFGIKRS
jgi:predicted ATPase with chaperone activity